MPDRRDATARSRRANERFEYALACLLASALMWLAFLLFGEQFASGYLSLLALITVVLGIFAYGVHHGSEEER